MLQQPLILLCYVIVVLNCITVDYFMLLCHDYLFSIVFIILYFQFYSPIGFTFTLQILFDLVLHLF